MRVKNRSTHGVSYDIPNGPSRVFSAGEVMDVDIEEIRRLMYQPGGRVLIEQYLLIPAEGRAQLDWQQEVQPEYDYTEEQVKNIMLHGSLDEFLDMLDFSPEGVISLVKNFAISLPLTDMNKMEGFKEKFGYDIAAAIKHQRAVEKELNGQNPVGETTTRQRRVQPSKYKVVE
jgi:hypothetical protein